jgi:hypothetical protein
VTDIVTVVDREVAPGIALVSVLPPSCGRCETDGGHCDQHLREMRARVPESIRGDLQNGYRVQLGYPGGAFVRAVTKLLLVPVGGAAALTAATWRWISVIAPDPALWHGIVAVGSAVAIMVAFAWRGGSEADLPVVTDLLAGSAPDLQPVEPTSVH